MIKITLEKVATEQIGSYPKGHVFTPSEWTINDDEDVTSLSKVFDRLRSQSSLPFGMKNTKMTMTIEHSPTDWLLRQRVVTTEVKTFSVMAHSHGQAMNIGVEGLEPIEVDEISVHKGTAS